MLNDDQVVQLLRGELELPFFGIVLKKKGGADVHEYRGPGEIRHRDGRLEVRVFDENAEIRSPTLWVTGELVPEGDYFTLTARDIRSERCGRQIISFQKPAPGWVARLCAPDFARFAPIRWQSRRVR